MSKETGSPLTIYAEKETAAKLDDLNKNTKSPVSVDFTLFDNWDDFLILGREVRKDDLFIIISSRQGYLSYLPQIDKLPTYLVKYFSQNSYIILYPEQTEKDTNNTFEPEHAAIQIL